VTVAEAKAYLGWHYVLHPEYDLARNPWHSMKHGVNVRYTWGRVVARNIERRRALMKRAA
jgi:hypothetical protein